MNKKTTVILALSVVIVFIGYMIFDSVRSAGTTGDLDKSGTSKIPEDMWKISSDFTVKEGSLKAVSVSPSGNIYLGGDSFISCYDKDLKLIWDVKTPAPVTSLCTSGDSIFASTTELVLVVSSEGRIRNEWGPFEDSCIITSVSSNRKYIAVADAGNKMVMILDKGGEVKKIIGQNDGQFIIPSAYFDVALTDDNTLFVANTGHRRVETRDINGDLKSFFGEPGLAPEAFCGCCAPAHFILIPDGFVTAEKGINRIKILNKKGEFIEFVCSRNNFIKSEPLDLASADGKTIYAAYPPESKLYIFTRK
jgi:hypothetical protein